MLAQPPLVDPKMQDITPLMPPPSKIPPPPSGTVREVSVLDEGEAVLQWPAVISMTSVAELEEWLHLVVRKLKRRAQMESEKPGRCASVPPEQPPIICLPEGEATHG